LAKFKKKPIVIEATPWFEDGDHPAVKMPTNAPDVLCSHCGEHMMFHGVIETLEGTMHVCKGDWIITGVKGEHYPCKPAIFDATYTPVTDPTKTLLEFYIFSTHMHYELKDADRKTIAEFKLMPKLGEYLEKEYGFVADEYYPPKSVGIGEVSHYIHKSGDALTKTLEELKAIDWTTRLSEYSKLLRTLRGHLTLKKD